MSSPYNRSLRLLATRSDTSRSGTARSGVRSDGAQPFPTNLPTARAAFYREELLKHRRCLHAQREYFSARAIDQVEAAITEAMAKLDHICQRCDCDHVVSCLLRQFDSVTRLSSLTDPKTHH